jgi:signal transduction histidine kinase
VLDFSKLEAGQLDVERIAWSPSDVARSVHDLLSPVAAERGLGLTIHTDKDVPGWITGDPTRTRQVLLSLVGDAIKFTPTGEVHIDVSCSANSL